MLKVFELRHAVGLGPDADLARLREVVISNGEEPLAIEGHRELGAGEVDAQGVPGAARHLGLHAVGAGWRPHGGESGPAPAHDLVGDHIVFQGIGASDVVVVGAAPAPYHAPRLILAAGDRLETLLSYSGAQCSSAKHD